MRRRRSSSNWHERRLRQAVGHRGPRQHRPADHVGESQGSAQGDGDRVVAPCQIQISGPSKDLHLEQVGLHQVQARRVREIAVGEQARARWRRRAVQARPWTIERLEEASSGLRKKGDGKKNF